MTKIIDLEGYQYHATDMAILFWTDEFSEDEAVWLPLSQIEVDDGMLSGRTGFVTVTMPEWLAKKGGLI